MWHRNCIRLFTIYRNWSILFRPILPIFKYCAQLPAIQLNSMLVLLNTAKEQNGLVYRFALKWMDGWTDEWMCECDTNLIPLAILLIEWNDVKLWSGWNFRYMCKMDMESIVDHRCWFGVVDGGKSNVLVWCERERCVCIIYIQKWIIPGLDKYTKRQS